MKWKVKLGEKSDSEKEGSLGSRQSNGVCNCIVMSTVEGEPVKTRTIPEGRRGNGCTRTSRHGRHRALRKFYIVHTPWFCAYLGLAFVLPLLAATDRRHPKSTSRNHLIEDQIHDAFSFSFAFFSFFVTDYCVEMVAMMRMAIVEGPNTL